MTDNADDVPEIVVRALPGPLVAVGDDRYMPSGVAFHFFDVERDTAVDVELGVLDDGTLVQKRVTVSGPGVPWSTLRHYAVQRLAERALRKVTLQRVEPDDDRVKLRSAASDGTPVFAVLAGEHDSESAAQAVTHRHKATTQRLERVAAIYREGGGGAAGVKLVAQRLQHDPRHARRLIGQARNRHLLGEGE